MGLNVGIATTWKVHCGIASYSENLATALSKQGVNVYIIRVPRFGSPRLETYQNIIDSIPVKKLDCLHVQHEYGLWKGYERTFFPSLKQLGLPVVTTMHSVGSWDVDRIIAGFSDRIIVHNEFCLKRLGYPEKSGIIPHGMLEITTPPPPENLCKQSMGIDPRTPIIGYVGYISSYKGLEMLIEAVSKIPKVALLIGGGWHLEEETEYTVNLKDWTSKVLPNRCRWLGFVSDEHLDMVYGAMRVVVYPSRFITESGALLMALSHGKAVIASDLAPVREKAKQGALMTFKNVADLTRKIKLLLKDDDRRHALEAEAEKFTQKNSWTNISKKHIELYESVVADKPNKRMFDSIT